MYYSVCVSAVFLGTPLPEALECAAKAGTKVFEIWSWWDQDLDAAAEVMQKNGLTCEALCAQFVPLTVPEKREEYLEGLKESIAAAKKLGAKKLIAQVGNDTGAPREDQHKSIVEGLKVCAPVLESEGMTLLIEPLNLLVDHRGYYLSSSAEAFEIVREVGSEHVKVLFDIYHQQVSEGNLIANLTANTDMIGHIHIAGVPGRHEPFDGGEVDYDYVLKALKNADYDGAAGLEYFPLRDAEEGLKEIFRGHML